MKRIVFLAALFMGALGAKAQSCETLVLPFFNWDVNAMNEYPEEKFEWRCAYARAAFYESDTIPAGAEVYSISEVVSKEDGNNLTQDFIVDLTTLSYYAYNFHDLQLQYYEPKVTICFRTPASAHQYLVLRSINDMYAIAESKQLQK